MKANFEDFVQYVAIKWRVRKIILEKGGVLEGVSRREQGDAAEDWVVKRIGTSNPTYKVVKSPGSRTPADIYTIARRKDYWHIMLIQVKSSFEKDSIYELSKNDIKVFDELAKVLIESAKSVKWRKVYGDKTIIVSTGYAGVWRIETNNGVQHRLQEAYAFTLMGENITAVSFNDAHDAITNAHELNVR